MMTVKVFLMDHIAALSQKYNVSVVANTNDMDFFNGAEISPGGFTIFALTSRNLKGESNIRITIQGMPNQLNLPDSVNIIATEYGIASLSGRTVRERAQSLIEIAHPEFRAHNS